MLITRGIEKLQIQRENRILREEIRRKDSLGDLIGSTDAMRHLSLRSSGWRVPDANVVIRAKAERGKSWWRERCTTKGRGEANPSSA